MNDSPSTPSAADVLLSPANSEADTQLRSGTKQTAAKLDANGGKSIKENLEIGGKVVLGLAGLCYVLGLVVVTIHLRRYGLNSLTLSQLQYVMAGVWVLLPSLVMMSLVAAAKFVVSTQSWKTKPGEARWPKVFAVAMVLWLISSGVYLGATYVLKLALGVQLTVFSLKGLLNWLVIPLLGAAAFWSVAVLIHGLIVEPKSLTKTGASGPLGWAGVWVLAVFMFFLIAFYITLFARFTYPEIPWSTGGGGSSLVKLVVAAEARPYLESVGVKFAGENRTESLRLLLATENDFVIFTSDEKVVSVRADSVKSVVYEK